MSTSEDAFTKLTKAKARLVQRHPFFATILLSLPLVEAEWLNPQTMATDMMRIYYHPKFVDECSVSEIMGVLCHEAMHVAYLHGLRKQNRDHTLWNVACDYAINPIVLDAGLMLPRGKDGNGGLYDDKYRNWTAQAIYDDLLKNVTVINISFPGDSGDGDGDDGKTPMWGGIMNPQQTDGKDGEEKPNGKGLSQSERNQLEQEIKIKVQQAAETAKSRGNMPGGVEGLIEAIGKPKVDWKEYIQQWVSGHTPDDYTWARPNRSMLVNQGIYMPRMQFNGAGIGVLSIDTSGSVSEDELRAFVREIAGVIEICNPDKLYIIQHDAIVHSVTIWEAGEEFKSLKITGRGGTCIQPTFKKITELDDPIDWMIIFSDMEIGDWPAAGQWPSYPTLLCGTGRDTSPPGAGATYIPLRDAI